MENIEQIVNKVLKEEDELYDKRNPERVNREIYKNMFKNDLSRYRLDADISMKTGILNHYISNLDKTIIKTPKQYYAEYKNAPIHTSHGSTGYIAPELFVSKAYLEEKYDTNKLKYKEIKKNPHKTNEHIFAPINPLYEDPEDECNFDVNTPINELVSHTYLKHMYNRPLLDSCRYLIKTKIINGEILSQENVLFLSEIDRYLYRIYLERHNLAGKNKKTRAKRNKKTKTKAKRGKQTKRKI